jgi:lysyl-tRNA synthetase class 2
MIEWYRLGFDDAALMSEVEALLSRLWAPKRLPPAERLSYAAALGRYAGVDAFDSSDADLERAARDQGIDCRADLDRDAKLDLLMGLVVGPKLGRERPCFICDYPASQAALARLKPGVPKVAARFELYLQGVELANGFHELADAGEQRTRFEGDLKTRRDRGLPLAPLDEHFLEALKEGLPECAGVALGFDRLVAIALGAEQLSQVLSFDIDNA